MRLQTILILIIVLACKTAEVQAQWIGDSLSEAHVQNGIQYIYNLSFDSARHEFQLVTAAQPDHPAGHFFLAMVEWWKIVTDFENTSHDDKFISMLDKVIDLCDKRLDKNEDDITGLFFKGGALGFQGRLYGNREDWLKAANCGRAALPIVQRAYKLEPNNYDVLLGIGIYNYYAAIIPDLYPWVKPLMFFLPEGDKLKGLGQLRTASEKSRYANVEATYFLMQVLHNYEGEYLEATDMAKKLHERFPNNVIFHKYLGRCYATTSQWTATQDIFNEVMERVQAKQLGYNTIAERESQYYLGLVEMELGKYDSALQYFYHTDELSRTLNHNWQSGFMVLTNLKIGMIYDLQGKRNFAIMQYNKVLDMKDYQNVHKLAEDNLKTPYQNK